MPKLIRMLGCVKENGLEGPKKSYTNQKQEYQLIPVYSVEAIPVWDKRPPETMSNLARRKM